MIANRFQLVLFLIIVRAGSLSAQTQEDFSKKMSEVYVNAADAKKAMVSAKELFQMVEKTKGLQTYANYYILKNIFETQVPDKELAKTCKEQADKKLAEMTKQTTTLVGDDPNSQWINVYFTPLFSTTDPENASKAFQFLSKNPSLQTFSNYNYVAYAYERNGDFQSAKENYEKAMTLRGDDKKEFHSYSYYTNFLSRSGEYLKAEEYLQKMENLSVQAIDMLKTSYKSESLTSKVAYYLAIGDYYSYVQAANESYDYFSKTLKNADICDPFTMSRLTVVAYGKEMLKQYEEAGALWKKRDSSHYAWVRCNNTRNPQYKQLPLSMWPVYLIKTGKRTSMTQSREFYVKETEDHFKSYSQYADLSINFMRAVQLGFLGASNYHDIFKGVLSQITETRNFRESTAPFAYYAYFNMRDHRYDQAKELYDRLYNLNVGWINDVIFSFGEKAFVTYYNSKLKDGYDDYHTFVKIAKEKQPRLYPAVVSQGYDNLLFTKSLSLKGTQKRKKAFLKANDPAITRLYEDWIDKKQQLIRQYRKAEDATAQQENQVNPEQLKTLQAEVDHLENELATKAKDFKKYLKISPPDWKSVRDQLKEGEAAIEMVRFQWRNQVYYSDTAYYAAYIVTKNSSHPEVVYLPEAATDLDNKYYKLLQNNIKFKLEDKESYRHFWKPIKDQLNGIKKIYFSPDGIYHLINLPVLLNPETGKYLLDEIDVHYTTSSTDIQLNPKEEEIKNAVLIGRPSYKTEVKDPVFLARNDATRSFVRNFRGNNIADLPGTEEEVKTIKKEMDQHAVKVNFYIKDQATEDRVYELHSPNVLHIATHGYWSEIGNATTEGYRVFNAMANSGLLLSGVVNYYSAQVYPDTYDGILTAYEAQNLDLDNTSMVILSACETSLGHLDAGEGVYGLQRAFRAAGAKSIMTSLWKVDDEATKEFMILFYQQLLKTNDKFGSFNAAQKALKLKYPEPYFWGAFILTGI